MDSKLIFAAEFGELEAQYARLDHRFALCRTGDRERIQQEYDLLADECREWDNTLNAQVNKSRRSDVPSLYLSVFDICAPLR